MDFITAEAAKKGVSQEGEVVGQMLGMGVFSDTTLRMRRF